MKSKYYILESKKVKYEIWVWNVIGFELDFYVYGYKGILIVESLQEYYYLKV